MVDRFRRGCAYGFTSAMKAVFGEDAFETEELWFDKRDRILRERAGPTVQELRDARLHDVSMEIAQREEPEVEDGPLRQLADWFGEDWWFWNRDEDDEKYRVHPQDPDAERLRARCSSSFDSEGTRNTSARRSEKVGDDGRETSIRRRGEETFVSTAARMNSTTNGSVRSVSPRRHPSLRVIDRVIDGCVSLSTVATRRIRPRGFRTTARRAIRQPPTRPPWTLRFSPTRSSIDSDSSATTTSVVPRPSSPSAPPPPPPRTLAPPSAGTSPARTVRRNTRPSNPRRAPAETSLVPSRLVKLERARASAFDPRFLSAFSRAAHRRTSPSDPRRDSSEAYSDDVEDPSRGTVLVLAAPARSGARRAAPRTSPRIRRAKTRGTSDGVMAKRMQ